MEPYMAYVTFKSIIGNRYVIQLSQIVSVQSIHTTNMICTIVIRTTSGKKFDVIQDSYDICDEVMKEYVNWLDNVNDGTHVSGFDFRQSQTIIKARIAQLKDE